MFIHCLHVKAGNLMIKDYTDNNSSIKINIWVV